MGLWMRCLQLCVADEEFDQLCFEYGIELDDVVSESSSSVLATQRGPMVTTSSCKVHGIWGPPVVHSTLWTTRHGAEQPRKRRSL